MTEFEEIKLQVVIHVTNLENNFKSCFSGLILSYHEWIQNLFGVTLDEKISHPSKKSQNCLMEHACDESLKMKFEALPLFIFGCISGTNIWNSHN
jgi:hypothetical protein